MMPEIRNIVFMDDDNFMGYIEQDRVTLLHFLSGSHIGCRRQIPLIKRFAEKYGDRFTVGVVDVTRCPVATAACGVKGIPNMAILRKGIMFGGYRGSMAGINEPELLQRLDEVERAPVEKGGAAVS